MLIAQNEVEVLESAVYTLRKIVDLTLGPARFSLHVWSYSMPEIPVYNMLQLLAKLII